jgi:hypothetical protein
MRLKNLNEKGTKDQLATIGVLARSYHTYTLLMHKSRALGSRGRENVCGNAQSVYERVDLTEASVGKGIHHGKDVWHASKNSQQTLFDEIHLKIRAARHV